MTAELRIIRLSKAAEVWIVILYMAAELQFVRLLKVKHERKQRLSIITIYVIRLIWPLTQNVE